MASNLVWKIMIKVGRVPEMKISAINRKKNILHLTWLFHFRDSLLTCK